MSFTAVVLLASFAVLVLAGAPFVIAIGVAVVLAVVASGMEPAFLAQQMVAGSQSFSLLAVPLFMFAGGLMAEGGISDRLIAIANAFVGRRTGGLAMATVVASLIFSAISGSAPATTAAIGSIMIPAMIKAGYGAPFSAAIAVSSGVLAPLIPPSIAFVIWGLIAEQSISKLFLSGVAPGLAIAAGLMAVCYMHARRHGVPRNPPVDWTAKRRALTDGKWALLSPAIILGGIYGGVFTPTEAAAVSCLYALIVGFLVEKRLDSRALSAVALRSLKMTALVVSIIAISSAFGVIVAQEQIASRAATALAQNVAAPWLTLLLLNLAFFLLATVMDEIAIMVIFGPLLIAIADQLHLDPIQFGAMIVTNVAIGMAAPPIGYCLFVGMAIAGLRIGEVAKAIWPQIVIMLIVLMITTYVPQFSLLLTR